MLEKDYREARVLDRLQMYERRIEHSLCRSIKELRTLRQCKPDRGHELPREADASPQDHRGTSLDDATQEVAANSAEQSQSASVTEAGPCACPMDQGNHEGLPLQRDGATSAGAGDCAEQSQLAESASRQTNPIDVETGGDHERRGFRRAARNEGGAAAHDARR
jgi:hypothetical protein